MKKTTLQNNLDEIACQTLHEPYLSKLKNISDITAAMRADAKRAGLHLNFTLDGRFMGDLGELIASNFFGVKLHEKLQGGQDGICSASGKSVEVKLRTQRNSVIWIKSIPDILLVLYLCPESFRWGVIYNGPGQFLEKKEFAKRNDRFDRYETNISKLLAARYLQEHGGLEIEPKLAIRFGAC